MRFDIVTIFPEQISAYLQQGILFQAIKKEILRVNVVNLRDFGLGNYRQVDDRVFGGGAGMLFMFEPLQKCLEKLKTDYAAAGITKFKVVATSAKGKILNQEICKDYAGNYEALIILCGRYEGFDQRIIDNLVDEELSLGKFVLTGGELAALTVMDATARITPGVLGKEESFTHDSFYENPDLAQFPQYTRPEIINYEGKELRVPEVLLSGHHGEVAKWREQNLQPVKS